MSTDEVPAWKYWHPLPFWKVLAIFAVAQIVAQVAFAGIFHLLNMAGGTGANVGAGVGGAMAVFVVWKLALCARAEQADDATGGDAPT